MLFFTIVFITYFLAIVIKGNLYYDLIIKAGEETIKQHELGKKEAGEHAKKFAFILFAVMLPMLITELIYLINALQIDYLKYPTILMLLNIIIAFAKIKPDKNDLTTEEGRIKYRINLYKNKKRTIKNTIIKLLNLVYFSYMFYLLVF